MSGTKPENVFIASVHAHLPPPSKLYRMKLNNSYLSGPADNWYSGSGHGSKDLWIEWKFIVVPKRDSTMIDINAGKKPALSALQRDWLAERHAEGRNIWVGIGSEKGGVILEHLSWLQPMSAKDFRAAMMKRKQLAEYIAAFVQGSG